jgi:hypothetical protein
LKTSGFWGATLGKFPLSFIAFQGAISNVKQGGCRFTQDQDILKAFSSPMLPFSIRSNAV